LLLLQRNKKGNLRKLYAGKISIKSQDSTNDMQEHENILTSLKNLPEDNFTTIKGWMEEAMTHEQRITNPRN
jgi:hypothetical protein